uniref:Uncharacterized protein n=1 Tax=Rhizophagus irregularis (strain DAOM 181602 / DAOM 197198 / MUCL 43194) TaxID=747089 RepID=U9TLC9_RHIID
MYYIKDYYEGTTIIVSSKLRDNNKLTCRILILVIEIRESILDEKTRIVIQQFYNYDIITT